MSIRQLLKCSMAKKEELKAVVRPSATQRGFLVGG
jgi:hypothetical protein